MGLETPLQQCLHRFHDTYIIIPECTHMQQVQFPKKFILCAAYAYRHRQLNKYGLCFLAKYLWQFPAIQLT